MRGSVVDMGEFLSLYVNLSGTAYAAWRRPGGPAPAAAPGTRECTLRFS